MMRAAKLIVMAKAPLIGLGKQRLSADIGRVEAWRINRALHAHTMRQAIDPRWRTILCVTPRSALDVSLPGTWPANIVRRVQCDGDLGARMAHALAPHRNVAIIGTDAPRLSRAHIAMAFHDLRRAPFALGPTMDGGFWLLAARNGRAAADAMQPVRWSSAHAMADVLNNLPGPVALLPTLQDIDLAADLKSIAQRSAKSASSGV